MTRMNSIGIRAAEPGPTPTGARRVLFLGDSFTQAIQVGDKSTFVNRVAAALSADGSPVQAINAGVSGASPAFYITEADWYRKNYPSDVVVVQLSAPDFGPELTNPSRTAYINGTGSELQAIRKVSNESGFAIAQRFPILREARRVLELPVVALALTTLRTSDAPGDEPEKSSEPTVAPVSTVDWVIASLNQHYPNLVILWVPEIDYWNLSASPSSAEKDVADACSKLGVPFVNPRSDFVETMRTSARPAVGFANTQPGLGHMNDLGHAIVAGRLVPVIERRLVR